MGAIFNTGYDYYANPDVVIPPAIAMLTKPKHNYMKEAFDRLRVPISSTPTLIKPSARADWSASIKRAKEIMETPKAPVDWKPALGQDRAMIQPQGGGSSAKSTFQNPTTRSIPSATTSVSQDVQDVVSQPVENPIGGLEATGAWLEKGAGMVGGIAEKIAPWATIGMGIADGLFANNAQRKMNKKINEEMKNLRSDIKRSFGQDTELTNTSRGSMNTARMMSAMTSDPNQQNLLGQMYMGDLNAMNQGLKSGTDARTTMRGRITQLDAMKQPVRSDFVAGLTGGLQGVGNALGLGGMLKVFNSGDMDTILKHYFKNQG